MEHVLLVLHTVKQQAAQSSDWRWFAAYVLYERDQLLENIHPENMMQFTWNKTLGLLFCAAAPHLCSQIRNKIHKSLIYAGPRMSNSVTFYNNPSEHLLLLSSLLPVTNMLAVSTVWNKHILVSTSARLLSCVCYCPSDLQQWQHSASTKTHLLLALATSSFIHTGWTTCQHIKKLQLH